MTMDPAHCYCCVLVILTCTALCTAVPEITQHPSDHNAYPDEMFSVSCAASGSTFQGWTFDNGAGMMKITTNDDYDIMNTTTSGSLTIKAFKKELVGQYRCLFTTEGIGSILTQPATVRHFVPSAVTVTEQPETFQSYVSKSADGIMYREVFAFHCSFQTDMSEPYSIMPTITWEWCNPDATFSPITEATEDVPAPGYVATDNIFTTTHIFFQTEGTGYLQIHDTNNRAYVNATFRCKASSGAPQDTQPSIYSDCAEIIHHPNTETVPDDLPFFSTVPIERVYFDVGHLPVMACTTQKRTDSLPPKLVHDDELIAIAFLAFPTSTLHFPSEHLDLLGQLNLQFNGTAAVDMDIYEQTFTCQVQNNGELTPHNTTFYRDYPLLPVSTIPFTNHTFHEGDVGELYLQLDVNSSTQGISQVFNDGELATVKSEIESDSSRIVFTFNPVMAHHDGVIQLEAENRVNIITEYYRVHVQLRARAVTMDMTVAGRVTQTLTIECKAQGNVEDTTLTFTWKSGDNVKKIDNFTAVNGMAISTYVLTDLSLVEHDKQTLECHPSNAIGEHNFTQFRISVELFPPPDVTKFKYQPDSKEAIDVEWNQVNVSGYPGASVEEYYIELAKDKDGSNVVAIAMVAGDNVSHVFAVDDCSIHYWVHIKAVNGNQDVSWFSDWMPIEAVACPITGGGVVQVLPAWAIFLIVLLLLLFCLLCLILFCLLLLCCKRRRDPKGVYYAEKREKLFQADRAFYRTIQAQECATLAKMS